MKKLLVFVIVFSLIIGNISLISYSSDVKTDSNLSKIGNEIYEAAETLEKIPVCIWYEDINQEEVEVQVEKEIGYSKDEIVSELPSISKEEVDKLYKANIATEETGKDILGEYLEENKIAIKREKDKTDKYISTRRKKAKDMYTIKSSKIISDANMAEQVVFDSKYAPMIIAELKLDEIIELANDESVISVDYIEMGAIEKDCSDVYDFDEYIESSRIQEIHENTGLTGENQKIGMIEKGNFTSHIELSDSRCEIVGNEWSDTTREIPHATNTARIISGTRGVAPNAILYSVAAHGELLANPNRELDINYLYCVEQLINKDVSLINSSHGILYNAPVSYYIMEKWIDHIANNHNVSFVVSAGNIDNSNTNGVIMSPGKAHNVITVGGCYNDSTISVSDDIMYEDSCYNQESGYEKPDIVAALNIGGGGTSSAAPVVTGTIALMLEARPSLAMYPEAIKAIIMASSQYKALPATGDAQETMASGLTEKQGAGVFNPYLAICIATHGNYRIGTLEASDSYEESLFYQPQNGAAGMNVSLAWLKNNTLSDDSYTGIVTVEGNKNLGLSLYKNNSTSAVASSDHSNSSAEMLYYTGLSDSIIKYKVRVSTPSSVTYSTPTRFAYAWCLNNEIYQKVDQYEGLYYIKNSNNGRYLTYDSYNNSYKLSTLSSSNNNQIFVIKLGTVYNILNGYAEEGGLTYENGNIISSSTPSGISIMNAGEGKIYLYAFMDGLPALNASSSTTVEWQAPATATNKEWIIEKISYRLGDVNKDGVINATDSNVILQYASRIINLYNNEKFLADVNNDGFIDSQDSLEVLKIAAKL